MSIAKHFALALSVPLCALAIGCGGNTPPAESPSAATPETPAAPSAPAAAPTDTSAMPAAPAAPAAPAGTDTAAPAGGGAAPSPSK